MDQNLNTIFILTNVVASKNYIKMHLEVMKDMNFFNDWFAFFTILRQNTFPEMYPLLSNSCSCLLQISQMVVLTMWKCFFVVII